MKRYTSAAITLGLSISVVFTAGVASAQGANNAPRNGCKDLPSHEQLKAALTAAGSLERDLLVIDGAIAG